MYGKLINALWVGCLLLAVDAARAADCNNNGIEDACDISCGTTGGVCDVPGCGSSTDCNNDEIPDDCQLVGLVNENSGQLSPIGVSTPQSFTIPSAPFAQNDVLLDFTARGDIDSSSEFLNVDINGTPVGSVFTGFFSQCFSIGADSLLVPAVVFNGAVNGGDAVINIVSSSSVSSTLCNPASFVEVTVSYTGDADCNTNGLPSECDIAAGTSADCNTNGIPDECEPDCNGNGTPDTCDLAAGTSADCNTDALPDECNIATGDSDDCNVNGTPDECELAAGTGQDCNGNITLDECDIAAATSVDCQFNGIPDECETDCNGNGIEDGCDVAAGTSGDCNGNIVPDECETDCNANGVADECDVAGGTSADCNTNGAPDECDIAGFELGEVLYGVERDSGALYTIDRFDGSLTLIGFMDQNIGRAFGLAIDPFTRELYAVVDEQVPVQRGLPFRLLVTVDRTTAEVNIIGPLAESISDIAFCDDGTLYGVVGNNGFNPGEIVFIGKQDASITATGVFGSGGGGQSIACQAGSEVLYHTYGDPKAGSDIETITLATGDVTFLNTLSGFGGYNALTFTPEGDSLLTYSFGELFSVDALTGDDQFIADNGTTVTGIAFSFSASTDCNTNAIPDECDISAGTAQDCDGNALPDVCDPDCNGNGSPDACDIATGFSLDCDSNGTPDECDPDCNSNGSPDACDITGGTSLDTNANDLPDECEFIDCNSNGTQDSADVAGGTSSDCDGNGIPDECELDPGLSFSLIGVSGDDNVLLTINPLDGSTAPIGLLDQSIDRGIGLDIHPLTGEIYAVLQINGTGGGGELVELGDPDQRFLATVDPQTAAVTIVGLLSEFLSDIAFRSDGTLFGISGNNALNPGEIHEVNLLDGSLTSTGIIRGNGGGQSIAFQPGTDRLFHSFRDAGSSTLSIVDLNTGGVTVVEPALLGFSANSMTFATVDTLWYWSFGSMYVYELSSGFNGLIGSASIGVTGTDVIVASNGDCNTNGVPDVCDIAGATSEDCNANAIPDACDIEFGLSLDENMNGVPDECRAPGDCNDDGVVDLADFPQLVTCLNGPAGGALAPGCDCADLDGDGDVDLVDFALFQLAFP
jgi:hypothetical protein